MLHSSKYTFFPPFEYQCCESKKISSEELGVQYQTKMGAAQRCGLEVYFFKLVIKLVKQCVLCDQWEVTHLATYSAWEMSLSF